MQIYLDKIKKILNRVIKPLGTFLRNLDANDITKIFFWFFVLVSTISSLIIYFVFIRTPSPDSLNQPAGSTVMLPTKELDQINANLNNKKNFKPAEIKKDPFAF